LVSRNARSSVHFRQTEVHEQAPLFGQIGDGLELVAGRATIAEIAHDGRDVAQAADIAAGRGLVADGVGTQNAVDVALHSGVEAVVLLLVGVARGRQCDPAAEQGETQPEVGALGDGGGRKLESMRWIAPGGLKVSA
jgi:hypothetical protein